MLGIPEPGNKERWYDFLKPNLRDEGSKDMKFPAQYMFKEVPEDPTSSDVIAYTLDQMDIHGIDKALIGIGEPSGVQYEAIVKHPDRFLSSVAVDPNLGMKAIDLIKRAADTTDLKSVTLFPAGCNPGVPINDKRMYPIYAKCCELDIPVCCCVGVPGPRVPMAPQHPELIDEVCWFFPELKFVMRHGAEPWTELAWKLMLKWPNLYYSTSCTPGTSRWASASTGSSPSCRTCRSATRSGRSSCGRTLCGSSTSDPAIDPVNGLH